MLNEARALNVRAAGKLRVSYKEQRRLRQTERLAPTKPSEILTRSRKMIVPRFG